MNNSRYFPQRSKNPAKIFIRNQLFAYRYNLHDCPQKPVYYAGKTLETALREHSFHMGRFYAATKEQDGWKSEVRELVGSIDADLIDLHGTDGTPYLDPNPDNYAPSQQLAAQFAGRRRRRHRLSQLAP